MAQKSIEQQQREPKDLRYRRACFKDADKLVFDTAKKGFVPLPIVMRKLLRHLSASEWRILTYLHLRCSRYGICYPTRRDGLRTRPERSEEHHAPSESPRGQTADFIKHNGGEEILPRARSPSCYRASVRARKAQ